MTKESVRHPPGTIEEQLVEFENSEFYIKLRVFGNLNNEETDSDALPKISGANGREAEIPVSGADESRYGNLIQLRQHTWDISNNSITRVEQGDKRLFKHDSLKNPKTNNNIVHTNSVKFEDKSGLRKVEERREQDISLDEDGEDQKNEENKPILADLSAGNSHKGGSSRFREGGDKIEESDEIPEELEENPGQSIPGQLSEYFGPNSVSMSPYQRVSHSQKVQEF